MKNKAITKTSTWALTIWNTVLFFTVWKLYYNPRVYHDYRAYALILNILLFLIIYRWLCDVYDAFAIASTSLAELIFSHLICFGIADLILYVQGCLIANRWLYLLWGILTVLGQIGGSALILMFTKRYMKQHMIPTATILIYGKNANLSDVNLFRRKLSKAEGNLFHIVYQDSEDMIDLQIEKYFRNCRNVIFYGVRSENRYKYIRMCVNENKVFYIVPTYEDIICRNCSIRHFIDTPILRYEYSYKYGRNFHLKRGFDILFSGIFLLIFFPFMLATAIAIKLEDGGPVFYRQKRVTEGNRVFEIYKFRSMIVDAEKDGARPATQNDARITKVGRVIRKTRIDELPQVLNILKGDMSFVGPRPERVENVREYTKEIPEFSNRLVVKGGLTGYAQVYGKYNTSAEDKLKLDMLYIENQSMLTDLKIILLTIRTMFEKDRTEGFDEKRSQEMNELLRKSV